MAARTSSNKRHHHVVQEGQEWVEGESGTSPASRADDLDTNDDNDTNDDTNDDEAEDCSYVAPRQKSIAGPLLARPQFNLFSRPSWADGAGGGGEGGTPKTSGGEGGDLASGGLFTGLLRKMGSMDRARTANAPLNV